MYVNLFLKRNDDHKTHNAIDDAGFVMKEKGESEMKFEQLRNNLIYHLFLKFKYFFLCLPIKFNAYLFFCIIMRHET
jgi:hypothetical protein